MRSVIQRVSSLLYNRNVGLFIVRAAAGLIFLMHGAGKLSDMGTTIAVFDGLGLTPLIAVMVAWLEVLGGIALILGIAPRIAAALLALEMIIAALLLRGMSGKEILDLELLLAAVCAGIVLLGSGRYALYKMECDTCNGLFCIKKNRVCVMRA